MKNKKLLFSLLGIAFAGIIITGCGKGDNTTTNPGGETPTTSINPTTPVGPGPSTSAPLTDDMWTVSFDYNYENKFKTYLTSEVKDGDKVAKPADPLRQGYDFVAWYDDPYCRTQYLWDFETPVRQSMTLYANWELNGEEITDTDYVIKYQTQLGASYVPVDGANLAYTAEYGDLVRFKIEVETEGYIGTAVVTANGEVINPDEDGIYSYAVTSDVTFEISGLTKVSNAYKVYYENPNGWTDVYVYMWDANSVDATSGTATTVNAAWPGERMSYDGETGMYYLEIESVDDCMYTNIIFNAGNGGEQTADLTLNLSYSTNATLYSGDLGSTIASEFDPKSTIAQITWIESDDYTFLTVEGEEGVPATAEKGTTVSFKVRIDNTESSGNATVLVNGEEITPVDEVYSFEVTKLRYTVKVTGVSSLIHIEYTLPTGWTPEAVNPRLYYWGSETASGDLFNLGAESNMTQKSGATYYIDLSADISFDGMIIVFDQGNEVKQSYNITGDLPTEGGNYEIIVDDWGRWEPNENNVWCFFARIAAV